MIWKTFKRGKARYYLVRMEITWGMVFLLVMSMASLILLCSKQGKSAEKEHVNYEHKVQLPAVSGLDDAAECYLCGNSARSLVGHYRGKDDLGIICLNQWYVVGLGVRSFEGQGDPIRERKNQRTSMFGTGKGGDFFRISQDTNRGISEIEIDYGENSIFNLKAVSGHLCQECLDKLLDVMDCYGPVGEDTQPRDLCIIDFQTMELYTLQAHNRMYFIRDYYVQIAMDDSGAEVNVFYMPVLGNEGKE